MGLFRKKDAAPPEAAVAVAEPDADEVSVVVIDDTIDIRAIMRIGLERAGLSVVGEAADAMRGVEEVRATRPDIVLLDLHMPEMGGIEALPLLLEASPQSRVVVYSAIAATRMTDAALDAGATGYIVKGVSTARIAEHLRRVHHAGAVRPVQPYPLAGTH
jgi:DNA-binding NarL/FixJ family response regulator